VRIIVVGGAGTIGAAVVELLSARHDVVVAGRQSGDVEVDISSRDSVRSMYRRIGSFDALACAAGEAHFGPFETATEDELALGVHSKLLGQMRLVLLGRSLISEGGSFTLISGYIFDDPIPEATSFAVANGGVEGFVRAAALRLERRARINADSPGMAKGSFEQFGPFNPGRAPFRCWRSRPPFREASRDGAPERSSGHGDAVLGLIHLACFHARKRPQGGLGARSLLGGAAGLGADRGGS